MKTYVKQQRDDVYNHFSFLLYVAAVSRNEVSRAMEDAPNSATPGCLV